MKNAILDCQSACHMPDVIEMPYMPPLYGARRTGENRALRTYRRLGGPTCLSGDVIGDYEFDHALQIGDMLLFGDMAIYTTCKNNTFNGMPLPVALVSYSHRQKQYCHQGNSVRGAMKMILKNKWKKLAVTVLAGMMVMGALGCGGQKAADTKKPAAVSGNITGSGSSALLPLVKDAAESFKKQHKEVSISLNAGGSGMGLKQVSDGSVDMGNSDVPAASKLPKEKADKLVDHKICVMTVATIVNKDVAEKVKSLTKQQLTDIFTAKITNWKEVGGPDEPITLVTRPKTSGTRALFSKYAMGGAEEAANKSLETDNSGLLVQSVAQNKGAIGYVALPYLTKNDTVATVAIDGVAPTLENTYSGKYNVWGYEHVYTSKNPKAAVKAFLDYLLSADYGKRIEELGYGVSSKMQVKDTAHD